MRVEMSRCDAPEPGGKAAIIFVEKQTQNKQKVQSTEILIRVKMAPSGSLPAAGRPLQGERKQTIRAIRACLSNRQVDLPSGR